MTRVSKTAAPTVLQYLGYIDKYYFEGTFDQVSENLNQQKTNFEKLANAGVDEFVSDDDLEIKVEPNDYDDSFSFNVYLRRPENEQERNTRLAREEAQRVNREAAERLQYEALKAKFEKK